MNFYSASSICPACNGTDVSVQYIDKDLVETWPDNYEPKCVSKMKRTCALCGYVWKEKPLFEKEK